MAQSSWDRREEGVKGAQCTERAFLTLDRKSRARKPNTRAVLLVKETVVVILSPRQYRMGKAVRGQGDSLVKTIFIKSSISYCSQSLCLMSLCLKIRYTSYSCSLAVH